MLRRCLVILGLTMAVLCGATLPGCAVHLVADYDQQSADKLIDTFAQVSRFYDSLVETEPADRTYTAFSKQWIDIATNVRVLLLRQRARTQNDESIESITRLLALVESKRAQHQRNAAAHPDNPYPDSKIALDRKDFEDAFQAALNAEVAKK